MNTQGQEETLPQAEAGTSETSRASRDFVGRERELRVFEAALAQVRAGRGQVLLLAGEPGIGKTRIATECATRAEAGGVRSLWGRAWEGEGAPAFWPWVQVVRSYIRTAAPATLATDLGRAGTDIARAMPELESLLPADACVPLGGSLGLQPEQQRFRFFDGLTLFLKAASRRQPLLIVLDDLQWADTPSLLLWQFVAQELADSHVLLMATYRESELARDHPLFQILGAVLREPVCQRLAMSGLDRGEIARYLEALSGRTPSAKLVAALAERTEGNPLFLRELVALLTADGTLERDDDADMWRRAIPEGIRQVIGRRLGRLSSECNHLLNLASAIGREFSLELLSSVANHAKFPALDPCEHERETLVTLLPAETEGLLQESAGGRYTFAHGMIREALYAELPAPARPWLHQRIEKRSSARPPWAPI